MFYNFYNKISIHPTLDIENTTSERSTHTYTKHTYKQNTVWIRSNKNNIYILYQLQAALYYSITNWLNFIIKRISLEKLKH